MFFVQNIVFSYADDWGPSISSGQLFLCAAGLEIQNDKFFFFFFSPLFFPFGKCLSVFKLLISTFFLKLIKLLLKLLTIEITQWRLSMTLKNHFPNKQWVNFSPKEGTHRETKKNVHLSRQEAKSSYSFCIVLTQRMCTSGTWLEAHPEFWKNYLQPYKNKWYSLVFLSGRSQNPLFAWLQQISSNCRHWSRYTETWRGCSREDRKVRQFSTDPSSFETC